MIRVERCESVCGRCEAQTGGRRLVTVVRIAVSSPTGGSGGVHTLCEHHAAQFLAALAVGLETADASCSSCGGDRKATLVSPDFKPRKAYLCQAKCSRKLHSLVIDALREADGWAVDWSPEWERPSWWGAAQAAGRRAP